MPLLPSPSECLLCSQEQAARVPSTSPGSPQPDPGVLHCASAGMERDIMRTLTTYRANVSPRIVCADHLSASSTLGRASALFWWFPGWWTLCTIAFSAAFAATALFILFQARREGHDVPMLAGAPVPSWLALGAVWFPAIRVAAWTVNATMVLMEKWLADMPNVTYILIGVSKPLRLLVSVALLKALLTLVHNGHGDDEAKETEGEEAMHTIQRATVCAVIFSMVELVKSLACRIMSLRVFAKSLFSSLEETVLKEQVLNKLMTKPVDVGPARVTAIATARAIPAQDVRMYLHNLYKLSLPMTYKHELSFTEKMTRLIKQFEHMSESAVDEHASHAAEYLWWNCRMDVTSACDRLVYMDLRRFFAADRAAQYAFSLFDVDDDGYIEETDLRLRVQSIYRERRNLAKTLRDTNGVIASLEVLVGGITHTCALFAYLAIFGVDVGHLVISLSSMILAFAFVFGDSMRTVYESVVFLFIVHPYEVGDWIMFEDKWHKVNDFGLISTSLIRLDGVMWWVHNQKLMQSDFGNITRSRNVYETLTFQVDVVKLKKAMLADLNARIQALIQSDDSTYLFNPDARAFAFIKSIQDPLKYEVGLYYEMSTSAQHLEQTMLARTHMNLVIGQWQVDHELEHSSSIQLMRGLDGGGLL